MSLASVISESSEHGLSRGAQLGPIRFVRVRENSEERVPVPLCNNEGQLLAQAGPFSLGIFRASVDEPTFRFSGIAGEHVFSFPQFAVRCRHLGRPSFLADLNVATLLNPELVYYREAVDPRGDNSFWVTIEASFLRKALGPLGASLPADRLWDVPFVPIDAKTWIVHHLMRRGMIEATLDRDLIEAAGHFLLRRIVLGASSMRGAVLGPAATKNLFFVDQLRSAISEDLSRSPSLVGIAERFETSVSRVCRSMNAMLGVTPHQYLLQLRLRSAPLQLREKRIADLALELGFSNHSHFTSAFRKAFGFAPSVLLRRTVGTQLRQLIDAPR